MNDFADPPHIILLDAVRVCHKLHGAAGPLGLDVSAWRRTYVDLLSDCLCDALSAIARRLCTSFENPTGLSSFVACRLIALDNNPGVRPTYWYWRGYLLFNC